MLGAFGGAAAVEAAIEALRGLEPDVTTEACEVLGAAARTDRSEGTQALDALAGLALAKDAPVEARLAAVAALHGLPDGLVAPIYEALARDPSFAAPAVRRAAPASRDPARSFEALVEDGLVTDPAVVRTLLRQEGDRAALTILRRAIEAAAAREREAIDTQPTWLALRADLHEVLARRGSQLALADLRETIEASRAPLPVGFLAAAAAVGDASCLDGLSAAWSRTPTADRWYRDHLVDVFGAIVARLSITREHLALRKILAGRPSAAPLVALAPPTASKRRKRR